MPEILKGSLGPEQQFKKYLSEGKFMIQKSKSLESIFLPSKSSFSRKWRKRFRVARGIR